LLGAAKDVLRLFPSVKSDLEELFRWDVRFRPEVVLLGHGQTFRMLAPNDLVVALAVPERRLIVIDYTRVGPHLANLEATLKHELCHLLLHANIRLLPRWFDEGVCQWATGGIAEILMDAKRPDLGKVALSGKLFRFDNLSSAFPEDREGLIIAYEQSLDLVRYITAAYGTRGLDHILDSLKKGRTMEEAVQEGLGIGMTELEKRWLSHLDPKISWLIYVSNNLYEILFFFAAILTLLAAAKTIARKLRDRNTVDEGDDYR